MFHVWRHFSFIYLCYFYFQLLIHFNISVFALYLILKTPFQSGPLRCSFNVIINKQVNQIQTKYGNGNTAEGSCAGPLAYVAWNWKTLEARWIVYCYCPSSSSSVEETNDYKKTNYEYNFQYSKVLLHMQLKHGN